MDIEQLLRARLEMEFGVPVIGDTLPPARVNADGQPRCLLSRHAAGYARFYCHDLPPATRAALAALEPEAAWADPDAVAAILAADAPVAQVWRVSWYVFAAPPSADAYPDVTCAADGYVIERDGRVVARAWTTADGPAATEVEVETDPAYRRRGYARQVVAAWAAAALATGKTAWYSHVAANDASRGVARSLGLTWLSDEVEWA